MAFGLWIDEDRGLAWAQGTHEYRPMGAAVIGVTDQFRIRDFRRTRRHPRELDKSFTGLFASLEDVNRYLRERPTQRTKRILANRRTPRPKRTTPGFVH